LLKSLRWQWLLVIAGVSLGLLSVASFKFGSLAIGDRSSNIVGGVPRLLFSYVTGCLLYRGEAKEIFGSHRFKPWLIALLPASLIIGGAASTIWPTWLVDVTLVALVMPPLVLIGARVELRGLAKQVAREGGTISYPLYALHIPLIGATLLLGGPPYLRYPLAGLVALIGSWIVARRLGPESTKRSTAISATCEAEVQLALSSQHLVTADKAAIAT
jgi:peptidoglycan/LPS O-acetylase OafA/YrhL